MRTDFKLVGLSKPNSMTCEPLENENTFWVSAGHSQESFNALFDYCKGNWSDRKVVEIECDSINEYGIPINPVFVAVKELQW